MQGRLQQVKAGQDRAAVPVRATADPQQQQVDAPVGS